MRWVCVTALWAQYPGHVDMQQKAAATSTLRAVAVLEWTGDRNHPNATRLVPVSLFDGEHLQDGALYLARPVPLALDSGTEYEVEGSGLPQGWFDIDGAREIGNDWFGFGKWKAYVPPPPKKLHPSRNPPTVVRDKSDDADKPHFVRRDQSTGAANQNSTANSGRPQRRKLQRALRLHQPRSIRIGRGCVAGRKRTSRSSRRRARRNRPARRPIRTARTCAWHSLRI